MTFFFSVSLLILNCYPTPYLLFWLFIYLFDCLLIYLFFIYYLFESGSCYVFLTDLELTIEIGWSWTHGDHMTSQVLGLQIRGNPTDIHLKISSSTQFNFSEGSVSFQKAVGEIYQFSTSLLKICLFPKKAVSKI